ncbi:unnamed protein product [Ixodes pacificus]
MRVAVGRLAHVQRGLLLQPHVQPRLLGARHVKGRVAVGPVALDAGAHAPLLADVAGQLPASRRDVAQRVDGLQEHRVGEAHLGHPQGAHHVGPAPVVRLLEGPAHVGAEHAVHGPRRGLQAPAAQPLALGNVGHASADGEGADLVHGQVAHVAEEDGVGVLALAVAADGAHGVLVDGGPQVPAGALALEV